MYDAVRFYRPRALAPNRSGPFALASLHRAENTDDPVRLRGILEAMAASPVPVLLPLHPRTQAVLAREQITVHANITILPPASYFAMLGLLEHCAFVLTDSGGLQKEAYFLGKKCVTVRDQTEWVELVACGANKVVGADAAAIIGAFAWALVPLAGVAEIYGRGDAGERIVRQLGDLHQGR